MTVTHNTSEMELQVMSEDACRSVLAAHSFGRLALIVDDGPTIFPVNYAYVEDAIVIRTAAGSKLASAPLAKVAFEIDYVDPSHARGWSVVARGHAFDISTAVDELSVEMRLLPFHSWLVGDKPFVIKINVKELTGRSFAASTPPAVDEQRDSTPRQAG
jgi:nitroimidazol reductase NimA-like FMN-containing flavoprotein (pyridoxamine 5'-phosphate oxidase superfamily)